MRRSSTSVVTIILVVLNVLGFVFNIYKNGIGVIFGKVSPKDLLSVGGMTTDTGYVSWITSMFQHGSGMHILLNMLALISIAPAVVLLYNQFGYLVGYLIAGLVGSYSNVLFTDNATVTVGASGAIFGMMGMLLIGSILSSKRSFIDFKTVISGVVVMLFNTFLIPGISISGHLGGLVGGVIIGFILIMIQKLFTRNEHRQEFEN